MRISRIFNLNKTQYELDFVDIDPTQDLPLFVDPYFLAQRNDAWSIDASRTIRSFFQHLVTLLNQNQTRAARDLFMHLGEPNETSLGLSRGKPKGRGIGAGDANKIFVSLLKSRAVQTGIAEDLEDVRIFVDGIDKDKDSDMTTNIIRRHVIEYTQRQCELWEIPVAPSIPSGFFWNRADREWQTEYTSMLVVGNRKLLLVPKGIVSFRLAYTPQRYHQHFILNYLQHEHLRLNSALVKIRRRKDGTVIRYVLKKDVKQRVAPFTKEFIRSFTQNHPEVFRDFKSSTTRLPSSLLNEDIGARNLSAVVDHMIDTLNAIESVNRQATAYHRLAIGILEILFYPNLTYPQIEQEIHEGRKRIDITFDNAANDGFFYRLHTTYQTPAQFIFAECKNYSSDPANPELDQLAGRFGLNRGKFGLLLCRTISDMNLFLKRCSDTYADGRGIILPLVDDDLIRLLTSLKDGEPLAEHLLMERFRVVAMR